jgi:competence protein ComEA
MSTVLEKYWLIIAVSLLLILICGVTVLLIKLNKHQYTEIVLSESKPAPYQGSIHIGGAVANPGYYPISQNDTIQSLIEAAGPVAGADLERIQIHVPESSETQLAQKINLNSAEPWLLEALPGIGQDRAQAIVAYRAKHGPFRRIEELLNIEGIGESTLNKIKDLITVED